VVTLQSIVILHFKNGMEAAVCRNYQKEQNAVLTRVRSAGTGTPAGKQSRVIAVSKLFAAVSQARRPAPPSVRADDRPSSLNEMQLALSLEV